MSIQHRACGFHWRLGFAFVRLQTARGCTLLVLGQASYARSSAAVVLDCSALRAEAHGRNGAEPLWF